MREATAKIRPVLQWDSSQERSSLQGVAKVWVHKDTLISLTGGVETGKRCWVERIAPAAAPATASTATDGTGADPEAAPVRRQALLATSPDRNIGQNVIMMTEAYRNACGFKLGDQVSIKAHNDVVAPPAKLIEIEPLEPISDEDEMKAWEGVTWHVLRRAGHVCPGLALECIAAGSKKKFTVRKVNSEVDNVACFANDSIIRIQNTTDEDVDATAGLQPQQRPQKLSVPSIPGLAAEGEKLNRFFRGFNTPLLYQGQQRSCALVIHGGRGTGKSFILDKIAATNWGQVFKIEENDKSSAVEEVFKQARASRPSIVLIDGLHTLIGKDRPNSGTIALKLGQQLDQLADEAWTTNALPKVVVIASCLDYMSDVPAELQRLTRFDANIPLTIPNAEGRRQILEGLGSAINPAEKDAALSWLSQNTHAFNPYDLCKLMSTALTVLAERVDPNQEGFPDQDEPPTFHLTMPDLEVALRSTRPTAMHDVNLKPPTIHWRDIGGQEGLKKSLQRMIRLTTTTDPDLRSIILTPPKGLLLYGPPGCSKTLSAQAMATESGFNFFAVKGAELLNMYVGESERAVRQLFERARSASPSIIFFDEIDSIGGQRAGAGPGGGAARSQGSVNMLTTLLTEMDGFEALAGVLILAATNRPESIDSALLRPGRFDRCVYVGLPDQPAREAIIRMNLGRLRTAPDVDIPELARLADGFSGAEMKQVCANASERAVDAWLDGIRGEGDGKDESMIYMRDVVAAIESTPRGVTQDMLDGYDRWAKRFART